MSAPMPHRPALGTDTVALKHLLLASFCRETPGFGVPIQVMPMDWAQNEGERRDRQARDR